LALTIVLSIVFCFSGCGWRKVGWVRLGLGFGFGWC